MKKIINLLKTIFAILISFISSITFAENWPQYEGALHQNSSTSTINGTMQFKWERRFTGRPVAEDDYPESGFASRNIVIYDNKLAIAAPNTTSPSDVNYVSILDCTDGSVLNSITTSQRRGPGRPQFSGAGSNWMEAYDTGIGFSVLGWDPQTEILFMSNGGDGPGRTGYKVLESMSPTPHAGTYGWQTFTSYPTLQGSDGRTRSNPTTVPSGQTTLPYDNWDRAANSNDTAFFDISLTGTFVVEAGGSNHMGYVGAHLINKYTGLRMYQSYSGVADVLNAGSYSPPIEYNSTRVFKMWGGIIADGNKVYYLCASQDCDRDGSFGEGNNSPVDNPIPGSRKVEQGLYIVGCNVSYADSRENGGYTGTGIQETANVSDFFTRRHDSTYVNLTSTPTHPYNGEDCESYLETDGFYRNKAFLAQGDGVWVAWKPSKAGSVELIRATASEDNAYGLGVGVGRRGQDIWPNISYINTGGNEYIVYYAANAWYKYCNGGGNSSWGSTFSPPLGPSELAVFDATQRKLKWTFELNNSSRTGNYPSLQPNEGMGYFERSRMVVSGNNAYIAWIDTTSTNAYLKIAAFDITASTPSSAPTPYSYDLGILSASNKQTSVMDLIAADGKLYAFIVESDALTTQVHGWTAQRVVCVGGDSPVPVATYSVSGSVTDGSNGITGVTVDLGGLSNGSAATSGSGAFSFSSLSTGTYVITPKKTNWVFTPQSSTITVTTDLTNQNFTGVNIASQAISGYIKSSSSIPIAGVSVALSGQASSTTVTDGNGYYRFTELLIGTYTIIPSKTDFSFSPSTLTFSPLTVVSQNQNFTGTYTGSTPLYAIIGTIQTSTGTALAGVSLVLSGSANIAAATDSSGQYIFSFLSAGNYVVTPSLPNWAFNPVERTYTALGADSTAQNYTAIAVKYAITGQALDANSLPINDVTMTLSGTGSSVTTTDSNGLFEFTNLSAGAYTIIPSKTDYTFTPSSRTYANLLSTQTAQNFTGSLPTSTATYSISGYVKDSNNLALSGINVSIEGTISSVTVTNSLGFYQFTRLSYGNYTITPSVTSLIFSPLQKTFSSLSANQAQDFISATALINSVKAINNLFKPLEGGKTTIEYSNLSAGNISVYVYSLNGDLITKIVDNQYQSVGYHSVDWDGKDTLKNYVPSGIYIVRIVAGSFKQTKKICVIK
ncbi:MAG: hypothetical protein A2252_00065 [Elusimicrobia bacterium RIFOXYA2_FULL_39_19]|nr:MAG: hypothetical protein A2252_00065 [Elusimicrobia bacterium RIFOXYA2_FULL_39_19]